MDDMFFRMMLFSHLLGGTGIGMSPWERALPQFEMKGSVVKDLKNKKKLNFATTAPLKKRVKKIETSFKDFEANLQSVLDKKIESLEDIDPSDLNHLYENVVHGRYVPMSRRYNMYCSDDEEDECALEDERRKTKAIIKKWKENAEANRKKGKKYRDSLLEQYQEIIKSHEKFKKSVVAEKPTDLDSKVLQSISDDSEWQVLNIPSVLEHVLGFLSLRSLYPCLMVNREWYWFCFTNVPVQLATYHSLGTAPFYRFVKNWKMFDVLDFSRISGSSSLLDKTRIILSKATVRNLRMPSFTQHRVKDVQIEKFRKEFSKQNCVESLTWRCSWVPVNDSAPIYNTLKHLELRFINSYGCLITSSLDTQKWSNFLSKCTELKTLRISEYLERLNQKEAIKFLDSIPGTVETLYLPEYIPSGSVESLRKLLRRCSIRELRLHSARHPYMTTSEREVQARHRATSCMVMENIFDEMTVRKMAHSLRNLMIRVPLLEGTIIDLENMKLLRLDNLDICPLSSSQQIKSFEDVHTKNMVIRDCSSSADTWLDGLNTDFLERVVLINVKLEKPFATGPNTKRVHLFSSNRSSFESPDVLRSIALIVNQSPSEKLIFSLSNYFHISDEDFVPNDSALLHSNRLMHYNPFTYHGLQTLRYMVNDPKKLEFLGSSLEDRIANGKFSLCRGCGRDLSFGSNRYCSTCAPNNYGYGGRNFLLNFPPNHTATLSLKNLSEKEARIEAKKRARQLAIKLLGGDETKLAVQKDVEAEEDEMESEAEVEVVSSSSEAKRKREDDDDASTSNKKRRVV